MINPRFNVFHLFTLSLMLGLLLPLALQDGMFMDGIQYACVSKNLAHGQGTFWFPWLNDAWTKSGSPYFMEHPPLVYGIQSLFFRLLGDSLYTERIYSILTALVSAFLIMKTWSKIYPQKKHLDWIPVLLWIITPVCFWSYQNNMQENTMGVFTLLATLWAITSIQNRHAALWSSLAGLAVLTAFLCKGVPGLFPLIVIPVCFFCKKEITWRKAIILSFFMLAVPALLLAILLYANTPAYESLHFYFYQRLLYRISDEPTTSSNFFILSSLVQEILPMLLVAVLIYICGRKTEPRNGSDNRNALLFGLIALGASLPLLITPVQRGFYLVPSFPFFALALASLIAPRVERIIHVLQGKTQLLRGMQWSAWLLNTAVLLVSVFVFAGKPKRDDRLLHDVRVIGRTIPGGSQLQCSPGLYTEWSLQFYLTRYFDISIEPAYKNQLFILTKKNEMPGNSSKLRKLPVDLDDFELFQKE